MTGVTVASALDRARLRARAQARFRASMDTTTRFFDAGSEAVSHVCLAMARRFGRGGRLLVFGTGAEATDAHHVAVEFVHPVLVGKRALPALALTGDVATLTGISREAGETRTFECIIGRIGRAADIALGLSRGNPGAALEAAFATARDRGMLTVSVCGAAAAPAPDAPAAVDARPSAAHVGLGGVADHVFRVPSADPLIVQEVQETLYHVMWELVHVFFEQDIVT